MGGRYRLSPRPKPRFGFRACGGASRSHRGHLVEPYADREFMSACLSLRQLRPDLHSPSHKLESGRNRCTFFSGCRIAACDFQHGRVRRVIWDFAKRKGGKYYFHRGEFSCVLFPLKGCCLNFSCVPPQIGNSSAKLVAEDKSETNFGIMARREKIE